LCTKLVETTPAQHHWWWIKTEAELRFVIQLDKKGSIHATLHLHHPLLLKHMVTQQLYIINRIFHISADWLLRRVICLYMFM